MLKMLLDANGGIVLTNDGNAILREIDVSHPAAKVQQRSGEGSCGRAAAAAASWPLVSRAPGRHASRAALRSVGCAASLQAEGTARLPAAPTQLAYAFACRSPSLS